MAWLRLDDRMRTHPKLVRLTPEAFCLHICGLLYCREHLTDGVIPMNMVSTLAPQLSSARTAKIAAGTLVAAGLWESHELGYQIHDFLDWNTSRANVLAGREEDRNRKKHPPDSERNPNGIQSDASRVRAPGRGMGLSSFSGESTREPSPLETWFGEWWADYPRKVGRKAAWREWQKINPNEADAVQMRAVLVLQRQSADWVKDGGRYIPHPRTYLAQGRYEDALEATVDPGPVYDLFGKCASCGDTHRVGGPCMRRSGTS